MFRCLGTKVRIGQFCDRYREIYTESCPWLRLHSKVYRERVEDQKIDRHRTMTDQFHNILFAVNLVVEILGLMVTKKLFFTAIIKIFSDLNLYC